jgi:hypothetical protein
VSQENVEIVRRFLQEFASERPEWSAVVARFWDADCDYYPVAKFPDPVPRHGRDEFSRWIVQTWDRFVATDQTADPGW